jgi:hypothetical protein
MNAPSTWNTSFAGPGGGGGYSRAMRSTSAVWTATAAAPAASVSRLGRLDCDGRSTGRFGDPPRGIPADRSAGEEGQFARGFGK